LSADGHAVIHLKDVKWNDRVRHETVHVLVGITALALLSWLCVWLGLRPAPAALILLNLIVLLSLSGGLVGAVALSFLSVVFFAHYFAPRIFDFRIEYMEDAITVMAFLITSLIVTSLVKQLRAGRDELANVLHAMPALVWTSSADNSIDFSNERFQEYTGLSSHALRDWGWMEALHPDDWSVAGWQASLAAGNPFEMEARIRSAAGAYRWFVLRMTPLRNERGTIARWCGAAIDVEERRRAEQALRRSEAYLAEAQRLSHTGSWAYSMERRHLLYSSEENFRLFGYDPTGDLPTNADWASRIHPEDRQAALETMRHKAGERSGYEIDYRVVHPDGTVKYIHSVAHPVFSPSGKLVEVVGTHVDLTERKQAEESQLNAQNELAHANRVATIGQLTASIAHEVNQPVAALVTNAHAALRLLKAEQPDLDQVCQALDDIVKDGRRVSDVIDRVRALVKKRPRQSEPLDINQVITESMVLTRGELGRNRISLETRLSRPLPLIRGDRIQLQQIMTNLMMNAIEAVGSADAPTRKLKIGSATDETENHIVVTVRDSGEKLRSDSIDQFFEAFYSTKSTGMGIGLSICRSIVEAHGGRIWATANADRGATFHVLLPVCRPLAP
jgi:PAS domain S-box-containing protein